MPEPVSTIAVQPGRARLPGLVLSTGSHDAHRPFLMDFLAGISRAAPEEGWTLSVAVASGLRDGAPPTINDDPTTRHLAAATGIVTDVAGPSKRDGAAWCGVRQFGITADADTDASVREDPRQHLMAEGGGSWRPCR